MKHLGPRSQSNLPSPRRSLAIGWLLAALAAGLVLRELVLTASDGVQTIPYSAFMEQLRAGHYESLTIGAQFIEARLKTPGSAGVTRVLTNRIEPGLARELEPYGVRFEGVLETHWLRDLLAWLLPVLLIMTVWSLLGRRLLNQGGVSGLMAVGKSHARLHSETDIPVHFDDVAGVDEAKGELRESVNFLKDPQAYGRLGARMPKGILLVGPPGTGKTLLARAMAGEAGVPFFSITGSEFVEMFVGVGAARVRDLFEQARAQAPCIVFIDELDALGRARGIGPLAGSHDEKEQTLNQLLAELDGFDASTGVVILAATNRPEILDPALLRAGRFDRQVLVDRPDRVGRGAILRVHLQRVVVDPTLDCDAVAALTPGFAGADLANLVNEAALGATRRGGANVTLNDFTLAIERIVAGLEHRQRLPGVRERQTVALHEMGHALVAMALPGTDSIHKISIIPRGVGALGYTLQRPSEDRYLARRQELRNRLAVLLAGRAAEALVLGDVSTGAADDLGKATDIAHDMVTRFGMSAELGLVAYERPRANFLDLPASGLNQTVFSDDTARRIDGAVQALITEAFTRATAVLSSRRALLDDCANTLMERETLSESELTPIAQRAREGPVPD